MDSTIQEKITEHYITPEMAVEYISEKLSIEFSALELYEAISNGIIPLSVQLINKVIARTYTIESIDELHRNGKPNLWFEEEEIEGYFKLLIDENGNRFIDKLVYEFNSGKKIDRINHGKVILENDDDDSQYITNKSYYLLVDKSTKDFMDFISYNFIHFYYTCSFHPPSLEVETCRICSTTLTIRINEITKKEIKTCSNCLSKLDVEFITILNIIKRISNDKPINSIDNATREKLFRKIKKPLRIISKDYYKNKVDKYCFILINNFLIEVVDAITPYTVSLDDVFHLIYIKESALDKFISEVRRQEILSQNKHSRKIEFSLTKKSKCNVNSTAKKETDNANLTAEKDLHILIICTLLIENKEKIDTLTASKLISKFNKTDQTRLSVTKLNEIIKDLKKTQVKENAKNKVQKLMVTKSIERNEILHKKVKNSYFKVIYVIIYTIEKNKITSHELKNRLVDLNYINSIITKFLDIKIQNKYANEIDSIQNEYRKYINSLTK